MKHMFQIVSVVVIAVAMSQTIKGEDTPKGPPLPFHGAEGYGGVFSTYSAYLVNPGNGTVGLPSVGAIYVEMNHDRALSSYTFTETLLGRVELGYGYNSCTMGDLPDAIQTATGVRIHEDDVVMHNFNARVQVIKEGDYGLKWMPAVTAGAHYKENTSLENIDRELGGTITKIGIADSDGMDYTLYASKMITALSHPVLIDAGLRATKAAHLGLLGFTDDYKIVAEGNVAVMATDRLIVAVEYRQKPNEYTPIPGLIEREDDWYSLCLGYIINPHATIAVGYARFGHLLNHEANDSFGVALKYEM